MQEAKSGEDENNSSAKPPQNLIEQLVELLKSLLRLYVGMFERVAKFRNHSKRWLFKIKPIGRSTRLSKSQIESLLQRQKDLKDIEKIAEAAQAFRTTESDFFTDPIEVERLILRILKEGPEWLYLGRVLSGGEQGGAATQELLYREQVVREIQDVTLFIPNEIWRDQPLASLTMRPARLMSEIYQARMLDQILPPEVQFDRFSRGEILIPVRNRMRHRLEFCQIERPMEAVIRKQVPIPIDMEGGGGTGGQLLYLLLDYSASMRGKSATLALSVLSAVLRANLGQRDTRYLYRRFAEADQMVPHETQPPHIARTLQEKDSLFDLMCAINFNGGATHLNNALEVAMSDVENLRKTERLEAGILLVTDGRAEILESVALRLRASRIQLHSVMVTPEANPSLAEISASFTRLDFG